MTLEEIFAGLSYGVLNNLAISGEGSGAIPFQFEPKVIHHLNQSLIAIYGRFPLHEKEVQIRAYDNKALYPLKKIYADSDATVVPQKFISDTVDEPFLEDVLKIMTIYDEDGELVPFNQDDEDCKVYTPTTSTIQLVEPVAGNSYFIIYHALHKKLVVGDLTQEVEVPEVLVPALYSHVGYQVFSAMGGQDNAAKAAEHLSTYESACIEITEKDLVSSSVENASTKLSNRGFV